METVLVVGATGNIGVSAVKGALNSHRKVLAIVRNQQSADKLLRHLGSLASDQVTCIEADILSDSGVRGVVDQVRAGELPPFQHVYSCVGGEYTTTPLKEITTRQLRYNFSTSFEANFFAYRDTIDYLLEQGHPASTWTICTGAQGDIAAYPVPAMPQGALFSMATAACRENANTNVRFNEVYLAFRVEVDEDAAQHGVTSASEFASVYEQLLGRPDIRSSRVRVDSIGDLKELKFEKKF
ncbi:NAD(P)-binding protein [Coniochaeta ligniaria NRRL 30616]|uniref:NAD(P)-binding protein n=1 Tax=Coniochaeta ligniaria NRRL 30616 TaxID=1408157 RepID=A0A1J7J0F6_9PEZI|nr:NAD(P)-binding protein [Coniochaeta ligniaria NRRL 30616]